MRLTEILVALPPSWAEVIDETDAGQPVTRRQFEEIDAFAAAMDAHSDVPVRVVEVAALPASVGGVLVVTEEGALDEIAAQVGVDPGQLVPRVFLLGVERRPRSARRVEQLGAAGAIEESRYFTWRVERDDAPGGGVLGRKEVARQLGATWPESALWETESYCFMAHDGYPTLPALLAAYLNAYAGTV